LVGDKLKEIGTINHYYTKIKVAIVDLKALVKVGDKVRIIGATTDFSQTIGSIEIEHEKVERAKSGDSIGIKVRKRVRKKDIVYKLD